MTDISILDPMGVALARKQPHSTGWNRACNADALRDDGAVVASRGGAR